MACRDRISDAIGNGLVFPEKVCKFMTAKALLVIVSRQRHFQTLDLDPSAS